MSNGEPLCLLDDSGTGTSQLLIGLDEEAAMAGHPVIDVLGAKLVSKVVEAA